MKTENFDFSTATGATTAYVARPNDADAQTPTVILIHEWWGVNDNIKDIAGRYAAEGFTAIAPDLYRGKIAGNPSEAKELMDALKIEDGVDTIKNAIAKARDNYGSSKFGISGFCMGGTFALRAACELPDDISAAAPFYGDIPPADVLRNLRAPVLFVAAAKDGWINPTKVASELKEPALQNALPIEIQTYEADHAFFNNTRPEVFDADAAQDAWRRVLELFRENLK